MFRCGALVSRCACPIQVVTTAVVSRITAVCLAHSPEEHTWTECWDVSSAGFSDRHLPPQCAIASPMKFEVSYKKVFCRTDQPGFT
ncbi:hypothetical protein BKA83DRAFT_4235017 [Pisolithus microcarpus]|nr:hypothetical protein BKA83DRAFT_4235017 [Pisolithus microcarpus]